MSFFKAYMAGMLGSLSALVIFMLWPYAMIPYCNRNINSTICSVQFVQN
jgi:hypothetical protein